MPSPALTAWRERGRIVRVFEHDLFVVDEPARAPAPRTAMPIDTPRPAPALRRFVAELGQLLARSEGLARNGRADLVWAAVTASPALAWTPRPWLALVLAAHLAVPLIHHDFLVRGLPRLHALGPVQAGGSLAVEWRFAPVRARPRP